MNKNYYSMLSQFREKVVHSSIEFWLTLGLLISFVFFYFIPTFFRYSDSMLYGAEYIKPRIEYGIGGDHQEIVNNMSRAFLTDSPKFVLKGPYPPFSIIFHMPFIFLDTKTSYITKAFLIFAAFIASTIIFPSQMQLKLHPAILVIFFSGLFSYGFQFEVERGQVNLIAISCSLISIWIFHRYKRLRWLAYLVFSLGVQLKVYPAIFILNLVDNWSDWKTVIKRFAGIGLLNLAFLFILGIDNFFRFFSNLSGMALNKFSVSQNHSVGSYVGLMTEKLPILLSYSSYITGAIMAVIFFCLALIGYKAFKKNINGVNHLLILACAVAVQLIPRTSFDYTLSILPAAMAFFITGIDRIRKNLLSKLILFLIYIFYGSTLFGSVYKYAAKELIPVLTPFSNNFPALFIMLVAAAALSFFFDGDKKLEPESSFS